MKRQLVILTTAVICLGLCSSVMANLTLSQSGSNPSESNGAIKVKGKKDADFFLEEWLYWLGEHLLGWDWEDDYWIYNTSGSGNGGTNGGSGNGGWDGGSGDGGWDGGSGDGGWDGDSGDGGWDGGSGDGDWDGGSGNGGWDGGSDDGGWDGGSGNGGCGGGSGNGGCGGGGDSNPCPVQPIPAPGAIVLSSFGMGIIGWLRRRHIL